MKTSSHLTLQSVGSLGGLQLQVIRQGGVVVQGQPVVLIADQRLRFFGVSHLHHVHGEVELRQLLRRVLFILELHISKKEVDEFLIPN